MTTVSLTPSPVCIDNPDGRAPFLLIGDHSGDAIPAPLGDLGVGPADMARHIALDIGVRGFGTRLADALDCPFVHQHYSRLVIDCNRDPDRADAIPVISDGTRIPGNEGLRDADRDWRRHMVHDPYQAAIGAALAARDRPGAPCVLVALHSFTPTMNGSARPWHMGVLHHLGDTALSLAMIDALRAEPDLIIGDNEPYSMNGIDHTVPRHCYAAGRPYLELEYRQDLLIDPAWQDRLATVTVRRLRETVSRLGLAPAAS